jgi:hypothetical protein
MLATNLTNPSPVRAVCLNPNTYMLTMISAFFRNTLLYLFTPQMRALLRALHHLSYLNGLYFSKWWYSASSFSLALGPAENTHILRHGTGYLHTSLIAFECHWVHIAATMSLPYYLTIWQPLGTETQAYFEHLNGQTPLGHVFFAAKFDSEHRHHINNWPDVAQEL